MDHNDVRMEHAQKEADAKYHNPGRGIVGVYVGYKSVRGQMTSDLSIVLAVVEKKPLSELKPSEVIPEFVNGVATDVVQSGVIEAYRTTRIRPVPGGWSVGHYAITAGTLGMWMRRQNDPTFYMLSNNHVLANSNNAQIGDRILQPGRYDGGTEADRIGALSEYVRINFQSTKKFGFVARSFWSAAKWFPNMIARLAGCPFRLVVQQPSPNLVDAAIAAVADPADVENSIDGLGIVEGVRDFVLGEMARKSGRTTEVTSGQVIGINGSFSVSYGAGRLAPFRDQFVVGGNSFSAPGDSGSAVLTPDNRLGGLLFAGGTGLTIVNKASHVVRLLGLTL